MHFNGYLENIESGKALIEIIKKDINEGTLNYFEKMLTYGIEFSIKI